MCRLCVFFLLPAKPYEFTCMKYFSVNHNRIASSKNVEFAWPLHFLWKKASTSVIKCCETKSSKQKTKSLSNNHLKRFGKLSLIQWKKGKKGYCRIDRCGTNLAVKYMALCNTLFVLFPVYAVTSVECQSYFRFLFGFVCTIRKRYLFIEELHICSTSTNDCD